MIETPFLTFWRALNRARRLHGGAEITHGAARTLWGETLRRIA